MTICCAPQHVYASFTCTLYDLTVLSWHDCLFFSCAKQSHLRHILYAASTNVHKRKSRILINPLYTVVLYDSMISKLYLVKHNQTWHAEEMLYSYRKNAHASVIIFILRATRSLPNVHVVKDMLGCTEGYTVSFTVMCRVSVRVVGR